MRILDLIYRLKELHDEFGNLEVISPCESNHTSKYPISEAVVIKLSEHDSQFLGVDTVVVEVS